MHVPNGAKSSGVRGWRGIVSESERDIFGSGMIEIRSGSESIGRVVVVGTTAGSTLSASGGRRMGIQARQY